MDNQLNDRSRQLDQERKNLKQLQDKEHVILQLPEKLEKIADMTKEEAEQLLITNTEKEFVQN